MQTLMHDRVHFRALYPYQKELRLVRGDDARSRIEHSAAPN